MADDLTEDGIGELLNFVIGSHDVDTDNEYRTIALISEVRRRRAADLSPFEVIALGSLRRTIAADPLTDQAAIAVLDKIIAAHGGDE